MHRVLTSWFGLPQGEGLSVCHFEAGAGGADSAAQDMADFWTALNPRISASLTWTVLPEVLEVDIQTGEIESAIAVPVVSHAGTSLGQRLPPQSQGMVQLSTGVYLDGRRLQGRIFIPGTVEEDSLGGGIPSDPYKTAVNAACATLVGSADSSIVVWRRPAPERPKAGGGTLPAHPGSYAIVNGATCKGSWATLRGRGFK